MKHYQPSLLLVLVLPYPQKVANLYSNEASSDWSVTHHLLQPPCKLAANTTHPDKL